MIVRVGSMYAESRCIYSLQSTEDYHAQRLRYVFIGEEIFRDNTDTVSYVRFMSLDVYLRVFWRFVGS